MIIEPDAEALIFRAARGIKDLIGRSLRRSGYFPGSRDRGPNMETSAADSVSSGSRDKS